MKNPNRNLLTGLNRRKFLATSAAVGVVSAFPFSRPARAQSRAVTIADIGVGDPGDWSAFKEASGCDVNVVAIGNAPSAVLNQLIAGGGMSSFDVIHIVGGMLEPLVENELIIPINTSRLSNWDKNTNIEEYLSPGTPGYEFIAHNDKVYGVPTVLQADSFAYLPDETGPLDSYGALFDPKFRGLTGLEDNYTTAGQKTALYLKATGQADIEDPADMTPEEIKTVIDFLIEKKKEGQFRVMWSSFEQAVNLLANREVHVLDAWEPIVFAAREQGQNVEYANPKEGYLLWAMAASIVNDPDRSEEELDCIYAVLDYMLGGQYGATITQLRGYMTNPAAVEYAKIHAEEFSPEEAGRIAEIAAGVKEKFEAGGTWQNRWPTHVDVYEEEWQRFKAS